MKAIAMLLFLFVGAASLRAEVHTPKPGSPERKAICDAMRAYVQKDLIKPVTKPFLFKIEFLRVEGDYAGFEGFPVDQDGKPLGTDVIMDIVYTTFLKRTNGVWKVVEDLSRTDVPSAEEIREIRKKFPAYVPSSVLPDFWRKLLRP